MAEDDIKPPLEGIRVLDLSRLVAGNVLTVVLGDFGADVIKIERPGRGDDLRHWRDDGIETWWKVYGRNKRSMTLDLKDASSIKNLKALVAVSDVFVDGAGGGCVARDQRPTDRRSRQRVGTDGTLFTQARVRYAC